MSAGLAWYESSALQSLHSVVVSGGLQLPLGPEGLFVHQPSSPKHSAGRLAWRRGPFPGANDAVSVPPGHGPTWRPSVGRRQVQIMLGVLWLFDGALQLQPYMYRQAFVTSTLAPNAAGQPGPLGASITWAAGVVSHHLVVANTAFATVQILIGVGLLVPLTVRPALAGSLVWGLAVWWVGEGFGLLFTGHASPLTGAPGAVLLYVVIAVLVWPTRTDDRLVDVDPAPLGELGGRAAWGLLWSGAAVLWLLPANRAPGSVNDALTGAATGEPAWLSGAIRNVARAADGHGTMIAVVLAVVSAAIGWGVFTARPVPFLAAGALLSVAFWIFGQAFGAILTGQGTDPNTGPLFVLLALSVLPPPASRALVLGAARYSMAPG